ncbi:Putative O-methyltransferase/MSMEI_4947 [Sporomusa ovata DSM 2662]|uniref:tRNA 5-hydroxyuridine methyltransferase n=1 Tax=Sporomusa ovata TaxID=2378 RepID=A0A0U1L308_9FIRM|nr:class I SAM-dependent methyltransferase [Sporomusa ovata]EQB25475.1 putative O-methyltransferase [Sporomusa ovata DSM 2662]CQR74040.1 FIG011945: O-methyltransferase family protein [Sporomusa ovata]
MKDNLITLLAEMEEYAIAHNVPILNRESGQLLQAVTAGATPKSVLEIGTAIGYSTLLLAANIAPGGKITTLEQDENRIVVARQFLAQAGVLDHIEIIAGNAGEVVSGLTDRFDLVFIDAAKGQYLDYLYKVMDKLSPGAIIIADNVLFRGWVLDNQATPRRFRTIVKRLQAYLDFVTNDARFDTVVHQTGDGMAVSRYQGEANK